MFFQKIKISILSILSVILIFLTIINCKNYNKNIPMAESGVIDLRKWDFSKDGIVALNGEWEFYWKQLLAPDDFKNNKIEEKNYIRIPGVWKNFIYKNKKLKNYGFATFRLIINTNDFITKKEIYLGKIKCNYKLWINDSLIIKNGVVGKTRNESKPFILPKTAVIPGNNQDIEIVLQVSNFHLTHGGIIDTILLGEYNKMQKSRNLFINFYIFLFGCLFIISFHHFGLFFLRKEDLSSFYFAVVCLLYSLRTLLIGPKYLINLFPDIMTWEISTKLEYLSLYISILFVLLLANSFFPRESNKYINYSIITGSIVFISTVLFFDSKIYSLFLIYWEIFILLASIYILFGVIIRAIIRKREGAILLLIGGLVYLITGINDMLFSIAVIFTIDIASIGLLIFIFIQAFIISMKFSKTYYKLGDMTQNLEKKVINRTKEIEEAKNDIERLNNERNDFFINFIHETKTPLTLIANYMSSYIKKYGEKEELNVMKQNFEKLTNQMNSVLDIEKFERGIHIYDHDKIVDFSSILIKKIDLFKKIASNKNISITENIKKNIFIKADPLSIIRIINNLIDNAVKYTDKAGKIIVSLKFIKNSNKVEFIVADTGVGIPEDQLDKIFMPYYQLSHKKRNIQGIGLGLSIVKKITDSLNAEIFVKSIENKGTAFTIIFNSYDIKNEKIGKKEIVSDIDEEFYKRKFSIIPEFEKKEIIKNEKNILLIEDNNDLLSLIENKLSRYFNVLTAKNGKEGLKKINAIKKPDIIISDIMMDEMDGWSFYEQILKRNDLRDIPFIFITAKASIEDKIRGLNLGAIDYIVKPFLIEELIAKINNILLIEDQAKDYLKNEIKEKFINILDEKDQAGIIQENYKKIFDEYNITPREREIIKLLLQGFQYKEISSDLNISMKTVSSHIEHIYSKFNIQNRIELINILKKYSL